MWNEWDETRLRPPSGEVTSRIREKRSRPMAFKCARCTCNEVEEIVDDFTYYTCM